MKKILVVSVFILAASYGAGVSEAGGMYIGLKSGMFMLDLPDVDDIIPIGFLIGYGAPSGISGEAEFNYGISGGEWIPSPGSTADFDMWTLAGYGVYRLSLGSGGMYLKGKAGILYEKVDAEATIPPFGTITMSGDDTGLSLGIGIGYGFANSMMIESEFTLIEADVNFFSIGANYCF